MPFVRFSRDRRGYEHTYLIHESGGRGRPARARVLYWFRTPPGVKVGRQPFDEEARRKIEAQNPGIAFDWKAIVSTPMPPIPEVEHWRERRRAERAAKVARRAEEQEPETDQGPGDPSGIVDQESFEPALVEPTLVEPALIESASSGPRLKVVNDVVDLSAPGMPAARGRPDAERRRRRRRGTRRRHGPGGPPGADGVHRVSVDAGLPVAGETDLPGESREAGPPSDMHRDTSED